MCEVNKEVSSIPSIRSPSEVSTESISTPAKSVLDRGPLHVHSSTSPVTPLFSPAEKEMLLKQIYRNSTTHVLKSQEGEGKESHAFKTPDTVEKVADMQYLDDTGGLSEGSITGSMQTLDAMDCDSEEGTTDAYGVERREVDSLESPGNKEGDNHVLNFDMPSEYKLITKMPCTVDFVSADHVAN